MEEETLTNRRLTRKEKRLLRQKGKPTETHQEKLNFNLKNVEPLTQNQKLTFQAYNQGKHIMLLGSAGSGKTFLSLYLALREVLSGSEKYKKIIICRSAEPSKNVGFLPGNLKEKTKVYEAPYQAICSELFGRGDAYEYLKSRNIIEFISTSYIRGITLDNSIVIVDEVQNLIWNEAYATITRIGYNCKIVFCGDYRQSDIRNLHKEDKRKDDILKFVDVIERMNSFKTIEFTHEDIVRSDTVKEFIIISETLGY
jgi:phosphate starvation-inducible protein PhoH and related proteins